MQIETENISSYERGLLEKIRALPPGKLADVETFIEFLHYMNEERRLRDAATKLSEAAFAKVWDNPEDSDYDRL
ncbi:MAG: toxin-antitoxin system, antitoxin component, Xre family protein [Nitrospirota bacterium]